MNNKNNYDGLNKEEKFKELQKKYYDYVSYYCSSCDTDVDCLELDDDGNCPYCKTHKSKLKLIDSHDFYKERIKSDNGMYVDYNYKCKNCKSYFDYCVYVENDFQCPYCGMEEDVCITDDPIDWHTCELCGHRFLCSNEDFIKCPRCECMQIDEYIGADEEYVYHCENCDCDFTSKLSKNAKCPMCQKKCDSPMDPEDREPDWEPTEEEWEDIQFGDD